MTAYNIAEAKANLSRLVEQAEAGEPVEIMRRGKLVARITPVDQKRPPIDVEALRRLTDSLPFQEIDSGTFVRRMRDDYRY